MKKVVISEFNWPNGNTLLAESGCQVVYDPQLWQRTDELKEQLKDADALIVRNQTQVNASLIDGASKLKVVGRLGVGLDNLNLPELRERGIPVVYGKNANAVSVAEYVLSAIFMTARRLNAASDDVKRGGWNRKAFTGEEVAGKTLGLIGIGEIGHRVAARVRALGMRVVGYDPFVSAFDYPIVETGIQLRDLTDVLQMSDYISLHVPLTAKTKHLIDEQSLAKMKPGAILINTARGGVVDEHALAKALANGRLSQAVLDVLEQEPPAADHPLMRLDNCILTPHVAGLTEQSQERVSQMVAVEVLQELDGVPSLCRVRM